MFITRYKVSDEFLGYYLYDDLFSHFTGVDETINTVKEVDFLNSKLASNI